MKAYIIDHLLRINIKKTTRTIKQEQYEEKHPIKSTQRRTRYTIQMLMFRIENDNEIIEKYKAKIYITFLQEQLMMMKLIITLHIYKYIKLHMCLYYL